MKLNNITSEAGGCTSTYSIYLDFLRDDPAIRCDKIIDAEPGSDSSDSSSTVPSPEPPVPPPPPVESNFSVRLAYIDKDCYFLENPSRHGTMLGLYGMEQPLDETYTLSLSLFELSAEDFSGSWLIANKDGEKYCDGSIDLMVKK